MDDLCLYLRRTVSEREGADIGPAARRALTDVIRSCRRGLGPAKRCEGIVLELMPDLTGDVAAWGDGGPQNPWGALMIGSWRMLREIEFSNAEVRSVCFNTRRRSGYACCQTAKPTHRFRGNCVAWLLLRAECTAAVMYLSHPCTHVTMLFKRFRFPPRCGEGGWRCRVFFVF